MMNDVYVLNPNLEVLGVIDSHKSLIWANRYRQIGDCELYVPANETNLALLQKNNYLFRLDDEMVCRIQKIELTTDPEDGNYLAVYGYDVKKWCDQRIVLGTMSVNGNQENFIRAMVNNALGAGASSERQIKDADGNLIFYLGTSAGFAEALSEQVSYKNIGEKIRDYCQTNGWGYKVTFDSVNKKFLFQLYKGTDRSASVLFSRNFENLRETVYLEDETNMGNFAVVAGEGEGSSRVIETCGTSESTARYEIYVDARDLSKTIQYGDLLEVFPLVADGGQGYIVEDSGEYYYKMHTIGIQILDSAQLARLQAEYPSGTVVTVDGNEYYVLTEMVIADLPAESGGSPTNTDNVYLHDLVYSVYLLARGYEDLAEYGSLTSFEGTIEPNTTFVFKQDYFLGDIVTVENEYGISVEARIVEVVEVSDDNGYYVEPKFEYISEE